MIRFITLFCTPIAWLMSAAFVGFAPAAETLEISVEDLRAAASKPLEMVLREGDLDEARQHLAQLVAEKNLSDDPELILADLLVQQNQVDAAMQVMEALAETRGHDLDVRIAFAKLAIRGNRWFDARTHVDAMDQSTIPDGWTELKITHGKMSIDFLRGTCSEKLGRWRDALKDYEAGLAKVPETPAVDFLAVADLFLGAARCHIKLGQQEAALERLESLTERLSSDELPELLLARLFRAEADDAQTEQWFQRAFEKDSATTIVDYGEWLLQRGRAADLQRLCQQSQRVEGGPAANLIELYLGMSQRMQLDFEAAESTLRAVHVRSPNDLGISNQLALVLIDSDDRGKQREGLKLAAINVELHPRQPETWATLGWGRYQTGDISGAKVALERLAQFGQISRDSAFYLGTVAKALGDPSRAEQFFVAALDTPGTCFYQYQAALENGGEGD